MYISVILSEKVTRIQLKVSDQTVQKRSPIVKGKTHTTLDNNIILSEIQDLLTKLREILNKAGTEINQVFEKF